MPQPHHRLPSMSQRMPSGVPGPASMNPLVGNGVAAGGDIVGQDLAVRHAAEFHDVEDFLVGEKHSPFGPRMPSATMVALPVAASMR